MAQPKRSEQVAASVRVVSPAFANGERIPRKHTCQGANASPPLVFDNLPEGTRFLALVMDDPDAPSGVFTHWTFWNLPAAEARLAEAQDMTALGAAEGRTDFGETGYGGPCPPSGEHRYFLKVFALAEALDLSPGADVEAVYAALEGKVLARGELMGTYAKA